MAFCFFLMNRRSRKSKQKQVSDLISALPFKIQAVLKTLRTSSSQTLFQNAASGTMGLTPPFAAVESATCCRTSAFSYGELILRTHSESPLSALTDKCVFDVVLENSVQIELPQPKIQHPARKTAGFFVSGGWRNPRSKPIPHTV